MATTAPAAPPTTHRRVLSMDDVARFARLAAATRTANPEAPDPLLLVGENPMSVGDLEVLVAAATGVDIRF